MKNKCKRCGQEITQGIRGRKRIYCSDKCYYLTNHQAYHDANPPSGLDKATVGAISEHKVILDLLSRGFNVFRACSPACPCDLVAMINDNTLRVEVTTGKYNKNNKTAYPPHNTDNYDVIAVVLPDRIFYYPEGNPLSG